MFWEIRYLPAKYRVKFIISQTLNFGKDKNDNKFPVFYIISIITTDIYIRMVLLNSRKWRLYYGECSSSISGYFK